MLTKISHIGIAVASLEESVSFYRDKLGMAFQGVEEVAEQKVKVAMLAVGESKIELLEPTSAERQAFQVSVLPMRVYAGRTRKCQENVSLSRSRA